MLRNFLTRIIEEFQEINEFLLNFASFFIKDLWEINDWDSMRKTLFFNEKKEGILYEFDKIIVILTEFHTVLAIDSKNGEILWKFNQ